MAEKFFPVLSHFQNKNAWLASDGRLRYRIVPTLTDEEGSGTLTVEVWEGPWAYEFSTVEATETFPLSQEGLDALPGWLDKWAQEVNARPKRTMAEDAARKKVPVPTEE